MTNENLNHVNDQYKKIENYKSLKRHLNIFLNCAGNLKIVV